MSERTVRHPGEGLHDRRRRHIGPLGTTARVVLGVGLVGSVVHGHLAGTFRPLPWLAGLIGFPAATTAWQQWRSGRHPGPLCATDPVAHVVNIGVFAVLYQMPDSVPVLWATSDAALLFYGASMVVAALRGDAGCEVLAVSNWLLGRDDQVGCLLFAPIDVAEQRITGAREVPRPS